MKIKKAIQILESKLKQDIFQVDPDARKALQIMVDLVKHLPAPLKEF